MKSAAEIIESIDKLAKDVWTSKDSPEVLSMAVVELSVLNTGLGNWLADALEAERALEKDLKIARNRKLIEKRKAKLTIGEAEAQALTETEDTWDQLLEVQNASNLYKIKRTDTQTLIDAIRSRLAVIREDIKSTTGVGA